MGMELLSESVVFSGTVYEDEIMALRDFLQGRAPERTIFDLSECNDIHLGVLQMILAYVKIYEGDIIYPDQPKVFQKVCEGFSMDENYCA